MPRAASSMRPASTSTGRCTTPGSASWRSTAIRCRRTCSTRSGATRWRSRDRSPRRSARASGRSTSRLRRELDLYALVRPCKSYPGVRSRYEDVDLVIDPREHRGSLRRHRVRRGRTGNARVDRRYRTPRRARDSSPTQASASSPSSIFGTQRVFRFAFPVGHRQRPPQGDRRAQGKHHETHRRALAARRRGGQPASFRRSSSRIASSTTWRCSSCRSRSCTT